MNWQMNFDPMPPHSPDFCILSLTLVNGSTGYERVGFGNNEPMLLSLEGARYRVREYRRASKEMPSLAKPNCIVRVYLK